MITAGELLHGSDADFVVNAYLAALGRWPEEGGFEHHLASIAGRPDLRLETLGRILRSEEGKLKALPLSLDATPVPPDQALAAQLRLRTEALRAEMAALRETAGTTSAAPALAGEVAALGADLAALRSEMRERLAALEALIAGRIPPAPSLSPAISVDYVNDLIEAAQAQLGHRLRAIEKKLLD
ncbi:hypothetical protein EJV46_10460 [Roseococcus sp. SYP-B2431]|uniref:hypothetical protein n=1 Tax=Roseococcus sp. SYP-B2431 TaxID=2496640 RepID=UPI00103A7720|nr:hypothetical protein [Roseococcus sp. SYP-B2431]TCH98966.1 hypothetical protein EJV46_10460 [Roseococcus sp. SYP-B2431]